MTIKECIDIIDNLKPNQYSTKEKVMWLSFIDEIIINDVLKTHEGYDGRYDDFTGYSEDKLSVPLIVPSPYDRLYPAYLKMKIDGENGETARYNNSAAEFNAYMMEYRKYYHKTHLPLSKDKIPTPKGNPSINMTDAMYENLKRELYYLLSEDFAKATSKDKLYDIVTEYAKNNIEMFKGKDGLNGKDGKDGRDGKDGVCTKGEKGEKGDKGDKGDAGTIEFIVVAELPTENIQNAIYLVPNEDELGKNHFDEYIYTNGAWEKIGSASVDADLTNYVKKNDISTVATTGDYNDLKNIPESVQVDTDLTVKDNNNGLPSPILFDGNTPKQTLYWNGKKADKFYADTDGATRDNPIIINTAEELAYVASATYENTYGKYFKIADGIEKIVLQSETYGKDIVALDSAEAVRDYCQKISASLHVWVSTEYDETKMCFGGQFDGNGAEIYGMYASGRAAGGLFGIIDSAVISNVAIKNSYINLSTGTENWNFGLIASFTKDKDTTKGDNITYINHCIVANNYIYKYVNENGFNNSGVILGGNLAGNYIIQNCLVYGNMATGYYSPSTLGGNKEYDLSLIGKTRNGIIAPNEFAKTYPDWVFNDGTNNLVKTILEDSIVLGTPPYAYYDGKNNVTLRVLTCDEDINCLKNVYVDWDLDQTERSSYPTSNYTPMFNASYFLNQTGSGVITKEQLVGDKAVTNAPNLMWGMEWFIPETYKGSPIPFDFLKFSQSTLLNLINNNKGLFNTLVDKTDSTNNDVKALDEKIDSKCVTSTVIYPNKKITLDFNSLYFLVSNSGTADVKLYNSSTDSVITDGDGNTLPDAEVCILIMPNNIFSDYGKRVCYFIGFTGSFSLTNFEVLKSRHFYLNENQNIYCKPPTNNLSVFKIGF